MHIITFSKIKKFTRYHHNAESSLNSWYHIVSKTNYQDFNELRQTFPSADQVARCTVFNIGGNNIRLIAAIHYNRKKIYIRQILTHAEYSKNTWKNECKKRSNKK